MNEIGGFNFGEWQKNLKTVKIVYGTFSLELADSLLNDKVICYLI